VSPSLAVEVQMDPLAQFDVIVPTFQGLAARTSTAQLDDRTPCTEWRVRDLLGHLLVGGTIFAALVRGDEPPAEVPTGPDESLPATASAAVADVDGAFRTPGALDRLVATPFGEMPGETFARFLAFDLLMHSWDLATATGQPIALPDEVVAEIDGFVRVALQPEARGDAFRPEVPPAADATPLERLVAFSGRVR
jgi:uncharacterized protein (TIGR03086 family)